MGPEEEAELVVMTIMNMGMRVGERVNMIETVGEIVVGLSLCMVVESIMCVRC
jgi:hypothetical protein